MRRIVLAALLGIVLPASAAIVLADEEKTAPAAGADQERAGIERLVQQLGADDFRAREEASRKLAAYGEKAKAVLEKAAKESTSPEVRWRVEQLLRRLRGAAERPLGAEAHKPGEHPSAVTEFDKMLEEVRKQMEEFVQRGPRGGFFGGLLRADELEAPGLVLERGSTGRVTLRVTREKKKDGPQVEDVYHGHSLEDILAGHPELARHPGMAELKRKDAERAWPGLEEFRKHFTGWPRLRVETFPRGSGFSMSTSQGVSIKQDANGVTVTIRETGADGKETTIELKGKDLEAIKKEHPEYADKLGRFGFSFRITPPNFFWPGLEPRRLDPLRPTTPSLRGSTGKVVFGLALDEVSAVLASHLDLKSGVGALVVNVYPGTQAVEMGILRNDVIVKVNGQTVGRLSAANALSTAGADRAPLEIELIRRGKPMTLKR